MVNILYILMLRVVYIYYHLAIRYKCPMRFVIRTVHVGQQIVEFAGRKATGPLPPALQDGRHFGDAVQRPLKVREIRDAYKMYIFKYLQYIRTR